MNPPLHPNTMASTTLSTVHFDGCFVTDARIGNHRSTMPVVFPEAWFATNAPTELMGNDPNATVATPHDVAMSTSEVPVQIDRSRLPKIGDIIDKYRIDAELGQGGFAAVYRATHQLMKTTVAIKLLYPWTLDRHAHLAEQLCEEARFTSLIDHPNVVRVHDVTASERFTYIVMEFIEGINLGRMFAERPLDPLTAVKVGLHVCAGLKAGLAQGLVHRDIKPANILISRAGQAKIVDFGLARRAAEGLSDSDSSRSRGGFRTGGTPAYIAPEQVTDFDHADFRADIYSLGATLYHALLGQPPFPDNDPLEAIRGHLHREPPAPLWLRPDLPTSLATLITRMLSKRPDDRHASYDELYADLRRIYHQLRSQAPNQQPASQASSTTSIVRKLKTLFKPSAQK